jgi:predicted metal-binding membrane protein
MNTIHVILIFLFVFISSIMWIVSLQQYDTMMSSMMMFYNPVGLSLFTLIWTAGMAAMMFPAITPMVLLYNRLIKSNNTSSNNGAKGIEEEGKSSSLIVSEEEERQGIRKKASSPLSSYPFKIILFVGSYLAVWALTGIAILIGWSIPMNYFFLMETSSSTKQYLDIVFGALLVISGLYQFSPLKTKCLGYCESPMSFFMRRWRSGITGAIKMGTYHGLYCLGCCWPYFLLMIALGWMNLLWMALFAAIIFGEKIWLRGGRWIARSAGVGFIVLGVLALLGILEIPTGGMEEVSKDNTAVEEDNSMNIMEMSMGNNENDHNNMDIIKIMI